jgi:hypothetical protein
VTPSAETGARFNKLLLPRAILIHRCACFKCAVREYPAISIDHAPAFELRAASFAKNGTGRAATDSQLPRFLRACDIAQRCARASGSAAARAICVDRGEGRSRELSARIEEVDIASEPAFND